MTEKTIVSKITGYMKYHKSSYAVYTNSGYSENERPIYVSVELLKYVGLGNYVSIGKAFQKTLQTFKF